MILPTFRDLYNRDDPEEAKQALWAQYAEPSEEDRHPDPEEAP